MICFYYEPEEGETGQGHKNERSENCVALQEEGAKKMKQQEKASSSYKLCLICVTFNHIIIHSYISSDNSSRKKFIFLSLVMTFTYHKGDWSFA